MPTMCIRGLAHWFIDDIRCVEHSIWLGVSLGALAASEGASMCEAALLQSRAIVALDSRTSYPI